MKHVSLNLCWLLLTVGLSGCVTSVQPPPSAPVVAATPTVEAAAEPTGAPVDEPSAAASDDAFPTILDAQLTPQGNGVYSIAVTVSSPYDTPQRYADGWRILAPDGSLLGEHTLLHDHAAKQPFTRTQSGVAIPSDVLTVTIEGRDLVNGYGGTTLTVDVPVDGQ